MWVDLFPMDMPLPRLQVITVSGHKTMELAELTNTDFFGIL